MRTFTKEQLAELLAKHKAWLNNEDGGERADLRYADLRSADLRSANLCSANLRSADLRFANLRSADLCSANLRSADLRSADLRYANLRSADLCFANLRSADLSYADLSYADLRFLQSANGKELACMNAGKYQVVLSKERIAIGCKLFTVEEWKEFDDATISMMDDGALEWWRKWKDLVFMFHKNIFG